MDLADDQFVELAYKMVFPWDNNKMDIDEKCYKIRREIPALHSDSMRTALVVMAIALNIPVEPNYSAADIAIKLDDKLNTICYLASGFRKPLLVDNTMKKFLRLSGLERIAPIAVSTAVSSGVTNRAILTPLFSLYELANRMRYPDLDSTYIRATPLMKTVFKDTFDKLKESRPNFDGPDKMRFTVLQYLISNHVTLDPEMERDVRYEAKLREAQEEVSEALNRLRAKYNDITSLNF